MADFVLKIHNDFDNLPAAADATAQFLERNGASSDVVFAANLAIEEIVSNIIKYGYHDALKHEITVRLALLERTLEIEICDDGGEFNPFNQPESDASSEARQIGGLGIHLVRNMLDTCSYERRDGQNIVKLSKKL